jgi:hypothetical protein
MNKESRTIKQEGNKHTYDLEQRNEKPVIMFLFLLKSFITTRVGKGKQTPYAELVSVCPCI